MNGTDKHGPSNLQSLLDQLRASQASQPQSQPQVLPDYSTRRPGDLNIVPSPRLSILSSSIPNPTITALLSQLNPASLDAATRTTPNEMLFNENLSVSSQILSTTSSSFDHRRATFQQSLPLLARLSEDQAVMAKFHNLRKDQHTLERNLWDERVAITNVFQEKVKIAVAKACISGTELSDSEIEKILSGYRDALDKHSVQRIMPAWRGLIHKQQTEFEEVGTPTMFATRNEKELREQSKVMSVLENIMGPDT